MVTSHLDKLVQYQSFLLFIRSQITYFYCLDVLSYAASLHVYSLGNTFYEATIPFSVTFIMSQFGGLTTACYKCRIGKNKNICSVFNQITLLNSATGGRSANQRFIVQCYSYIE